MRSDNARRPLRRYYFQTARVGPCGGETIEVIGRLEEREARTQAMRRLYGTQPQGLEWTGAGLERIYE